MEFPEFRLRYPGNAHSGEVVGPRGGFRDTQIVQGTSPVREGVDAGWQDLPASALLFHEMVHDTLALIHGRVLPQLSHDMAAANPGDSLLGYMVNGPHDGKLGEFYAIEGSSDPVGLNNGIDVPDEVDFMISLGLKPRWTHEIANARWAQ